MIPACSHDDDFLATSTAAVAAGTFGRVTCSASSRRSRRGHAGLQGAPAQHRLLDGARRHDRMADQSGRRRRGRQPVPGHRRALCRAAAEDVGQDRDRRAHQHASSRRPHRRQRRVPSEDEADHRARERAEVHEGTATTRRWRGGRSRIRRRRRPAPAEPVVPDRTLDRRAGRSITATSGLDQALRPRAHRRRHRHPLREGERRAHGRPDVQPPAPGHRPRQRRLDRELDDGAEEGGGGTAGRHDLHLRPRRAEVRGDRQPRRSALTTRTTSPRCSTTCASR